MASSSKRKRRRTTNLIWPGNANDSIYKTYEQKKKSSRRQLPRFSQRRGHPGRSRNPRAETGDEPAIEPPAGKAIAHQGGDGGTHENQPRGGGRSEEHTSELQSL